MGHDESNGGGEDPELEAIKARVQAMEEEAIKLKEVLRDTCNKHITLEPGFFCAFSKNSRGKNQALFENSRLKIQGLFPCLNVPEVCQSDFWKKLSFWKILFAKLQSYVENCHILM